MLKKIAFISALALSSMGANAEFIATDFLVSSDHRATLDTETGLEWLDLDYTTNMSIAEAEALMGEGQSLEGWRLPTQSEMLTLLGNIFPIAKTNNALYTGFAWGTSSTEEAQNFRSFFAEQRNATYQYGLFRMDDGLSYISGSYIGGLYAGIDFYAYERFSKSGVWLVSDGGTTLSSINDPSINANNPNAPVANVPVTFALGGLAMLGLGLRRKVK